jgi:hypothetical protein
MPFIPANLDDAVEQKPAPKGKYELQITGATMTETGENSKHPGAPMIKVTLGFTDLSVNAPVITHFITLPFEGDENANFKLLMLKRFLVAFKIPYSSEGIDTDTLVQEMPGQTAELDVGLSEPNENGDIFNRVQIPRIRDEAQKADNQKARRRA